jgi:hypothetical protein
MTLRIDKWPRPERSGMLAVLIAYALLELIVQPILYRGDEGKPSLLCTMAPFVPECWQPHPQVREPEPPRYHVTKLVYCPSCKVRERKDDGICFWEVRTKLFVMVERIPADCDPGEYHHDYRSAGTPILFLRDNGYAESRIYPFDVSIEYCRKIKRAQSED